MKDNGHMIMGFFIGILIGVLGKDFSEFFNYILYILFVGLTVVGTVVPNLIESPHGKNYSHNMES